MRNPHGRILLSSAITLGLGAALLAAPTAVADAAPGLAASTASAGEYRVVDLGVLADGSSSEAAAINERGHVAGESGDHAVLWRDGGIVDLGVLPRGTWSRATDLNDRDEVVGYGSAADGTMHAFLWRNGRMRDLGVLPGGENSFADGINDAGDVVGWSATRPGNGTPHAVRWHAGRMTDMDPGGLYSTARDITNDGLIVGDRMTPEDPMNAVAVMWRHNVLSVLIPGGAVAANDHHQIAGLDFSGRSFLWSRGVVTWLAAPVPPAGVQVEDIDNAGRIVGTAGFDAVIWQRSTPVALPRLTGVNAAAHGINDRGQVVGSSATTPDGLNPHAVLWTR